MFKKKKKQEKTIYENKNPNETGTNNLLDKEFKAIVTTVPTWLRKRIDDYSENFTKNNMKHEKPVRAKKIPIITEMKCLLERISGLGDT